MRDVGRARQTGPSLDSGVGVIDVRRTRERLGPRQRAVRTIAACEHMASAHAVSLDAEGKVGVEPDRDLCPRRVRRVPIAVPEAPLGRLAPVAEDRLAHELDLDRAVQALDCAHEQVLGVVVCRRSRVGGDLVLVVARSIVSASRTTTQPVGVLHVVTSTFVPGSYARAVGCPMPYGPNRNTPTSRSSRLVNTLGESKRGTHSQSIEPSGATSAPVWQLERNA